MNNSVIPRISDESGRIKMELAGRSPLTQDMLNLNDSFLLDHGGNKIFIWHGKFASREEKKSSMVYASVSLV